MIKRSHKRRKRNPPEGSTRAKGDVVEQIVATMHRASDVSVETNVFLCSQDEREEPREVDVLLSSQVGGYPVHIAIECKNEERPTGVNAVDAFIGKLKDVGIPPQLGIFVSASRYTSGAIRRAQKAGIKTLLLRDVTEDLPESVRKAFQSLVYLLATIISVQVENDMGGMASPDELMFFRDEDGKVCGSVADLVWLQWISENIPGELGIHQVECDLPEDWHQIIRGQAAQVSRIRAEVEVTGHVITFAGSVSRHELVRASDMEVDRWRITAQFDNPSGTYPVSTFYTEDQLEDALSAFSGVKLKMARLRLPRVRWMVMYWPPSESTMEKLWALLEDSLEKGEEFDLRKLDWIEIEGTDIRKAWEPIVDDHPLAELHRNQEAA